MQLSLMPILSNRKLLLIVLSVIFVVVMFINIVPLFLNGIAANLLRQQVESIFGDKLSFGNVHVSLWRGAEIVIDEIYLAEPPGFGQSDMLQAEKVRIRFELIPLLHRQLIIHGITVYDPDLYIIQNADGRMNTDYYVDLLNKGSNPNQPAFNISLKRFEIKNARVSLNSSALSRIQPTFEWDHINLAVRNLNFPNPSQKPTYFSLTGLLKADHPAKIEFTGQGVLLPNDINFNAHSRIRELPLPEFAYLLQSPDFNIKSGMAWVNSTMSCKHNYFYSRNHVNVQNLKIAGRKGHLGGQLVFGLPANLFIKAIEDKHGVLQLDFVVEGPLSRLQAHTGNVVSSAISNAMRAKFGGVKSIGSKTTSGIKKIGVKTKNVFKKLFSK